VTNSDRVRDILALAGEMRVDDLIAHFAEDAVMELPFAPGRMEKRYDGRAAIHAFQSMARDSFSSFAMTVDAIHATDDPNVVIAEHRSDGVVAANGRPYRNRYVSIFTFGDDGLVTRWCEYYDPGVVVRAFRRSSVGG
jgi:ketosteroid isomerase-like protein